LAVPFTLVCMVAFFMLTPENAVTEAWQPLQSTVRAVVVPIGTCKGCSPVLVACQVVGGGDAQAVDVAQPANDLVVAWQVPQVWLAMLAAVAAVIGAAVMLKAVCMVVNFPGNPKPTTE
jgi:hypothetical protein